MVFAVGLALGALPVSADTELVGGQPPLTREMVGTTSDFYAWLFDVYLTQAQQRDMQDMLVESWQNKDQNEIEGTLESLKLHAALLDLGPAERAAARENVLAQVLSAMGAQPNQPTASWVLSVYDAAHRPIAAGSPPLTRYTSDASAEMMLFVLSVALEGRPLVLDKLADTAFKDSWAQNLVGEYAAGNRTREQQAEMANTPLDWAKMRGAWPALTTDEQDMYHTEWLQSIKDAYPEQVAEGATPTQSAVTTPTSSDSWSSAKWSTAMRLPAMRMHP